MGKHGTWSFTVRAPADLKKMVKEQLRPLEGWRLNQWMVRAVKNEVKRNRDEKMAAEGAR